MTTRCGDICFVDFSQRFVSAEVRKVKVSDNPYQFRLGAELLTSATYFLAANHQIP